MTRDELIDLFTTSDLIPFIELYQRRTGTDISPLIPNDTQTIHDFINLDHHTIIKDFSPTQESNYLEFIHSLEIILRSLLEYHQYSYQDYAQ